MHGHFERTPKDTHTESEAQQGTREQSLEGASSHVSNIIFGVLPMCTSMCFFGRVGALQRWNERVSFETSIHVPDALDDVVNTESRNHISPLPPSASLFTVAQLHTERVCVCARSLLTRYLGFIRISDWRANEWRCGSNMACHLKCWNAETLKSSNAHSFLIVAMQHNTHRSPVYRRAF